MKYCYKCKIIKNIEDFNKNKSTKDGLQKECKKCEVRCVNCHMRKTAKEQNWFKLLNQANKQPEN